MIGVFDSGIGGLSVHRALVERLPRADFVYLADQAHAPYGPRGGEEIVDLTRAGCERLFDAGADLIVLACNTASAIALRRLQQDWLPGYRQARGQAVNILGLIVPTIEAATGMGWDDAVAPAGADAPVRSLGVFCTRATAASRTYEVEIAKRRPEVRVTVEPCPDLARQIEAGAPEAELASAIRGHVDALMGRAGTPPDRVVLGCTHYELVAGLFTAALPRGVGVIHQPPATADALQRYLERHPAYQSGGGGQRRFLTTGAVSTGNRLVESFWGASLRFEPA